jgi:acetoin utilization deacetylase AcuC-like enzyme
MHTALALDPLFKAHETGEGHPERPARYDAVTNALKHAGLLDRHALRIPPREATPDELARVHTRHYLELVDKEIAAGVHDLSTGDTTVCPASAGVARKAVGTVLNAVDAVCQGDAVNAFCAVRPPGHHATPSRGMGFCIYNNIALAARHAQRHHGVERVLIVDWDVHHGNGTQDAFYHDGSVYFFSTHQAPWYPGTGARGERGEGAGEGCIHNAPLPAGSGRKEILHAAFEQELVPAMKTFKPEMVFISAGFDSRRGDPLGRFQLTDDDFRDLTHLLLTLADQYAGGRVVSVLEGGYSLEGLAQGVTAHVRELAGASLL